METKKNLWEFRHKKEQDLSDSQWLPTCVPYLTILVQSWWEKEVTMEAGSPQLWNRGGPACVSFCRHKCDKGQYIHLHCQMEGGKEGGLQSHWAGLGDWQTLERPLRLGYLRVLETLIVSSRGCSRKCHEQVLELGGPSVSCPAPL